MSPEQWEEHVRQYWPDEEARRRTQELIRLACRPKRELRQMIIVRRRQLNLTTVTPGDPVMHGPTTGMAAYITALDIMIESAEAFTKDSEQ